MNLKLLLHLHFFTALENGKTMKIKLATSCIIIGTMLAPAYAADQNPEKKQAMTEVKDSPLAAKVRAKLAEEKFSSLPDITIDTDATGKVFLGGRVKSEQEADRITKTVRMMEGVTAVRGAFQVPGDK